MRKRLRKRADRWLPYLLIAPALVLVGGLLVYPVVWAIKLSLYRVPVSDVSAGTFVGLANYRSIFADPHFYEVLGNTVVFVGASVVGQVAIGLGLAVLLDGEWPPAWATGVFRATFLLPWATTGVIVAYSWQFVFDGRLGLVNGFLRWVGVAHPPAWLHSVQWAMVALVVANVWRGVPFSLVFQTSGLTSIRPALHEAAAVGGASRLQTLRHVTLPLLAPFIAMNVVLVTLFTVNVFDIVFVMTGGGPLQSTEVLSLYMYETAFDLGRFGRANALAVVLMVLNLAMVGLYLSVRGGDRR